MKSMGKNQPVRCPKCRSTSKKLWLDIDRVPPFNEWVQPPIDARRHLSKPLDWN
jgi:tRNA(Ile2) C34 agmatinyltransferase TiaS